MQRQQENNSGINSHPTEQAAPYPTKFSHPYQTIDQNQVAKEPAVLLEDQSFKQPRANSTLRPQAQVNPMAR